MVKKTITIQPQSTEAQKNQRQKIIPVFRCSSWGRAHRQNMVISNNISLGISFIISIVFVIHMCHSEYRECLCTRQEWMDDIYVPERQLWFYNLTADDKQICSLYCMLDEACVSFYFNTMTYVCSGHSIVLANLTHAEPEPGNIYFTMDCRGKLLYPIG